MIETFSLNLHKFSSVNLLYYRHRASGLGQKNEQKPAGDRSNRSGEQHFKHFVKCCL